LLRSLTYLSGNSSTYETQTHQTLYRKTPLKAKLNKLLSIQKTKFLTKTKEKKSSTLEFFHLISDNFLNKGFANFVKVQSKLTLQNPCKYRFSYETKQCAFMKHFMSLKVYRFLQKSWSLPSVRTLQKTVDNWEINLGLNEYLLKVLAVKANSMIVKSKEFVLGVDEYEMSLKSSFL